MYDILKRALDEALTRSYAEEISGAEKTNHTFSPEFENKMKELIRQTDHPYMKYVKILTAAACAVIAIGCVVLLPRLLDNSVPVGPDISTSTSASEPAVTDVSDTTDMTDEDDSEPIDDDDDDVSAQDDDSGDDDDDDNVGTVDAGIVDVPDDDDDDANPTVGGDGIDDDDANPVVDSDDDGAAPDDGDQEDSGSVDSGIVTPSDDDDDADDTPLVSVDDDDDAVSVDDDDDDDDDDSGAVTTTAPADDDDDSDDDDSDDDDDADTPGSDYDDDEDADDDDSDDDDADITVPPPVIKDTLGEQVRHYIGCSVSDSYLYNGFATLHGTRVYLPVNDFIPPEMYKNAEFSAMLEKAVHIDTPAYFDTQLLYAVIINVKMTNLNGHDYYYSERDLYDWYYRGISNENDEEDSDDYYDEYYDNAKTCIFDIYSDGIVGLRCEGYGNVYYRMSDEALAKLKELLEPLAPVQANTVDDLRLSLGASADSVGGNFTFVYNYYDITANGYISDTGAVYDMLRKYGGTSLSTNVSIVNNMARKLYITLYSSETPRTLALEIFGDGTVKANDRYIFKVPAAEAEAILSDYCLQKGLAPPVLYRDLGEYLSDKNFTSLSGVLMEVKRTETVEENGGNTALTYYDQYVLRSAESLEKFRKLFAEGAGKCAYAPGCKITSDNSGERIVIQASDWLSSVSINVNRECAKLRQNRFTIPEEFYDTLVRFIKENGEFVNGSYDDDDDDDYDDEINAVDDDDDELDDLLQKSFGNMKEALDYAGIKRESINDILFNDAVPMDEEGTAYDSYRPTDNAAVQNILEAFFTAAENSRKLSENKPSGDDMITLSNRSGYTVFIFDRFTTQVQQNSQKIKK